MAESILRDKSKEFAKQIVFLCRDIKANMKESVLTNQLLRSGTSILRFRGADRRDAVPSLSGHTPRTDRGCALHESRRGSGAGA